MSSSNFSEKDFFELVDKLRCKDNEIEELKNEIKKLKKAKSSAGRKNIFSAQDIEIIKMTSLQLRDGKYPSQRTLAKEFNCSVGLINKILKKKE